MNDNSIKWAKEMVAKATYELMDDGVLSEPFIKAKPEWMLPEQLVIGKTYSQNDPDQSLWFICGDIPLLSAHKSVAQTPREAARYFAYRWQAKIAQEAGDATAEVERAEALYQLTEIDELWGEISR